MIADPGHREQVSRERSAAVRRKPRARAIAADAHATQMRLWLAAVVLLVAVALTAGAAHARGTPDGFADLSERLLPAVVNVSTTQTAPERGPDMPQFPPGSPFEDFFKDFFDRQQREGGGNGNGAPQMPRRATSLGSGFIIDPAGFVVTNNHVVQDADEISVILLDDTVLKAEVIGRDPKTDLALLKVETDRKLPFVEFGDSGEARVGEWVMAIGNPFGLGGTVTAGIISAKTRDINAGPYDSFIQTDAAINRGNSGGPLFNMDGEVIGINTAIFSPTGGSVGVGFATPSNMARQVIADIREYGRTRRGWLGVTIQSVTDEIAESLGLDSATGALVASVQEGSPAQEAGLQPGDIILELNDREVKEMRRLPTMVAETEIGKSVTLDVWRDGQRIEKQVTIAELEETEEVADVPTEAPTPAPSPAADRLEPLGLSVSPVTAELKERYNLSDGAKGIVVTEVDSSGPAAEKGVSEGELIVEVNQTPVQTAEEARQQIANAREAGRKSVLLLLQSESGMRFTAVNIGGGDSQ